MIDKITQPADIVIHRYFTEEEGNRAKVYPCSEGFATIGIGKNLDTNPLTPEEEEKVGATNEELKTGAKTLSPLSIDYLFWNDIARCTKDLETFKFWHNAGFTLARKLAILSMRFQLGATEFRDFAPTIEHLNAEAYVDAAKHILACKAARQTPKRYTRIARMVESGSLS